MKPFRIAIPKHEIKDLKTRLKQTRWPDQTHSADWERGVPLTYLKSLVEYWSEEFDWEKQEALLNQFPQYITEIDGQPIHFLHIKSPEKNAIPLLMSHGWPGSFVEFTNVIGPLTNPKAFGKDSNVAFDLVIPSIPGFGFSIPVKDNGWNMMRMAGAFTELMKRLDYDRFGAQGGDLGAGITGMLVGIAAQHLIGTHVNTDVIAFAGIGMLPKDLAPFSGIERMRLEYLKRYEQQGTAYLKIQATRPQTLAYALTDSPVGQLAWIIEKFKEWTDSSKALPEHAIDKDLLLTNASIYWFNKIGASAAHILFENMNMAFEWGAKDERNGEAKNQGGWAPPKIPSAMAAFGNAEDGTLLKRLLEPMGPVDHWSSFDRGCHFPAMEVPELLVEDIRDFFGNLK